MWKTNIEKKLAIFGIVVGLVCVIAYLAIGMWYVHSDSYNSNDWSHTSYVESTR